MHQMFCFYLETQDRFLHYNCIVNSHKKVFVQIKKNIAVSVQILQLPSFFLVARLLPHL